MFNCLIQIEPLGFLYGSAGRFLSPDNLVGRSGTSFPPSAATVAGMIAASQSGQTQTDLFVAGPFWAFSNNPKNFYMPTPFSYLAKFNEQESDHQIAIGSIEHRLHFEPDFKGMGNAWVTEEGQVPSGKFAKGTWLAIDDWEQPSQVYGSPWRFNPHLHPRLSEDERCVQADVEQGSLFLENAVQMHPDTCLIYLSNKDLSAQAAGATNWLRFGGESHIVETTYHSFTSQRFDGNLGQQFALITPGVWGSKRQSYRFPEAWSTPNPPTIFTERPQTFRYRIGGRLSRGRYAVPAGTIYITKDSMQAWKDWDEAWFAKDGLSLKHWGCGLALPLPDHPPTT
ncbi:MAG: CRISPR-associated protein Cmr3 [Acaryochloris sp. RU_4_1]|nr:CRISPR-associated protein Cmr3 [Acaryochloris sp. SU_5_25]NJM67720.1 CRISPR-associated protein Cmr3 [Acaryochloris sp. RU_4_1]NJN39106.1 CRISPR-associated protein Cmr3 [Acaryochloridaceae cyanobacterium CSU_3_4]NJR56990.1 CRISPR-associated protein Cmr3 [Acaryochloris sp. CRU_2_0]